MLGYSALVASLCFVPVSLGIMVLSQVVTCLLGKISIRIPLLISPSSVAAALLRPAHPVAGAAIAILGLAVTAVLMRSQANDA